MVGQLRREGYRAYLINCLIINNENVADLSFNWVALHAQCKSKANSLRISIAITSRAL